MGRVGHETALRAKGGVEARQHSVQNRDEGAEFRVRRDIGDPPPGESPDRTFLTLELRLQRSWAISAVIGDRGASILDLLWRKRY